jgi:hypothetical protein
MQSVWFFFLVSAICLEGLGRKYLPEIPSVAFYFLKDLVLLCGYYWFRPPVLVRKVTHYLYRGFGVIWVAGLVWTIIEFFNPAHESTLLGIIGLRAYWVWWLAPLVIAGALQNVKQKQRAIYVLLVMAIGISTFAVVQFASPPDSTVNLYSVVDGEAVYADQTIVASTGKARVSSTFSFLSGFSDFSILVPTLLLSLGLEAKTRRLRQLALAATLFTAAVVPMSGSRISILLGGAVLVVTSWTAGLLFTRVGRRIVAGAFVAAILALAAFPEALLGVQSRFEDTEETTGRVADAAMVLPPVALALVDYPVMGIGTGMQQNARASLRIYPKWEAETEVARYLIELGPVGFLLIWTAKLGLMVALFRAYRILKEAGRRGPAGAALSYALLTMFGNLTFDHIWQALYFMGCGFILAEVVAVIADRNATVSPSAERSRPLTIAR